MNTAEWLVQLAQKQEALKEQERQKAEAERVALEEAQRVAREKHCAYAKGFINALGLPDDAQIIAHGGFKDIDIVFAHYRIILLKHRDAPNYAFYVMPAYTNEQTEQLHSRHLEQSGLLQVNDANFESTFLKALGWVSTLYAEAMDWLKAYQESED